MTFSALGSFWTLQVIGLSLGELQSKSFIFPSNLPRLPLSRVDPEHSASQLDTPQGPIPECRAEATTLLLPSLPPLPLKPHSFNALRKRDSLPCLLGGTTGSHCKGGYCGHCHHMPQVTIDRSQPAPGHPGPEAAEKCFCAKESRAPLPNTPFY